MLAVFRANPFNLLVCTSSEFSGLQLVVRMPFCNQIRTFRSEVVESGKNLLPSTIWTTPSSDSSAYSRPILMMMIRASP